jgi:hypothetical protein
MANATLREQEYAYGTLREQKFRSMPASLKIEEFRSNPINYSVTPATSVTSVFFFLRHAARTGVEKCNKKVAIPLIIL